VTRLRVTTVIGNMCKQEPVAVKVKKKKRFQSMSDFCDSLIELCVTLLVNLS